MDEMRVPASDPTSNDLAFSDLPETPDMPIEAGDVLVSMNLTETTDLTAMMSPKSLAEFLKHYGSKPADLAITPEAPTPDE